MCIDWIVALRIIIGSGQHQREYSASLFMTRLVLSDGDYYQQGMLATQLNNKVESGELKVMSIITMHKFICNVVANRR